MLIFVIPSVYPNERFPGAGIFVKQYVNAISSIGYKVVVLDTSSYGYKNWNSSDCKEVKYIDDEGIGIYTKHIMGFMISRFPKIAVNSSYKNLIELYNSAIKKYGKPDLLVAHFTLPAGFAAMELSRKFDIPLIIIEHESIYLSNDIHKYIKKQIIDIIEYSREFICVSDSLKNHIEKIADNSKKIIVIPNMIEDFFVFSELEKNDNFVFFSAGNLTKNKRFDLLINAFAFAFKDNKRIKLRIAGIGPEEGKLRKLIRSYNLENQVELIGYVKHNEILSEYKKCNCFILLSEKETFGIVYREAMAVGRPIIASRNGGVEEKWDDNNGILLNDDSIKSVSNSMEYMIKNFSSYDLKQISNTCINNYSKDIVLNKHDSIIRKYIDNENC